MVDNKTMKQSNHSKEEQRMKTTVEIPQELWREAKIRAMDEGTDFRTVVIAALEAYLKTKTRKEAGR